MHNTISSDHTKKLAATYLCNVSLSEYAEPSLSILSLAELADHSIEEMSKYQRGDGCNDQYGLEIVRRATLQRDQDAWECLQVCFSGMVRHWMHRHPNRDAAFLFASEEDYIAQAFERFWLATACHEQVEFSTLAGALQYLRTCLHGAILDTLRAYSRPKEIPLPEAIEVNEPFVVDGDESAQLWEVIQSLFPNEREQRVAYLLFHCGLKPREIVQFCSQEFSDIREIYRLRRNIVERLVRNADRIRWRLNDAG
jgi:DNA-directed RNA polymerase specialized sigma24 family protein